MAEINFHSHGHMRLERNCRITQAKHAGWEKSFAAKLNEILFSRETFNLEKRRRRKRRGYPVQNRHGGAERKEKKSIWEIPFPFLFKFWRGHSTYELAYILSKKGFWVVGIALLVPPSSLLSYHTNTYCSGGRPQSKRGI